MPLELACRRCGAAFLPTKADLVRGPGWYRLCPRCRDLPPATPAAITCQQCGRPLRAGTRTLCAQCLGITM